MANMDLQTHRICATTDQLYVIAVSGANAAIAVNDTMSRPFYRAADFEPAGGSLDLCGLPLGQRTVMLDAYAKGQLYRYV